MTDVLSDITRNGLCMGCGACVAAIADPKLKMSISKDGFLRPVLSAPLSQSENDTVKALCVGRSLSHDDIGNDYHPIWGPVRWLGTGYASDPEVRYRGSSGGVISAIAIALVEKGLVDFVVATGADPKDPIGNITTPRRNRDEIVAAAGSRYAPSSPLVDIERYLSEGKSFAFIGKPCDVAALRQLAKRDPRIDQLVPYMIAFFCAGVPSRSGTVGVLAAMGVDEANVAAFRYRGDGWPGLARAKCLDGTEKTMDYNSSWGTILNRHLQFRCKICPDGTGEFADIACADAWYGDNGYPDFSERSGRSLIVARTSVGNALICQLAEEGRIRVETIEVSEISKMQPYQVHRKRHLISRVFATWLLRNRSPHYRNFALSLTIRQATFRSIIRDFLGTVKRLPRRSTSLD